MRFSFKSRNNVPEIPHRKRLIPIGISRATNRLDEIRAFYSESIGVKLLTENTYYDGTTHITYMWNEPEKGL